MTTEPNPPFRLLLSLVLLSCALIAFQLEQMQLLALVQWYHFAYLVISVALLGFGTSGTLIALYRFFLLRNMNWLLPVLMFACAITMALALPLSYDLIHRFDIGLLVVEPAQIMLLLLLSQFIYLLVFFLGSLPLGLVFVGFSHRINRLYCANLLGSGIGGVAAVLLMYFFLPQQLPAMTALLVWLAGVLVIPPAKRIFLICTGAVSLAAIAFVLYHPKELHASQYKSISRILDLPGSRVTKTRPSPLGLVQLVTAPALRYAPGLSLAYDQDIPSVSGAVFSNGDWFGAVSSGKASYFNATLDALPWVMTERKRVLVLQSGTGMDIIQAAENKAEKIVAVEPQAKAATMAKDSYNSINGDYPRDPNPQFYALNPRTWLALHKERYDLITLPIVGVFGGASGLLALQEEYLLTREAFLELWNHLTPDGVVRVSAWLDSPNRSSLRLAATIAETLEEVGVDPLSYVLAARSWNMITFVMKRSPLDSEDITRIRSYCETMQFDPALLPGLQPRERARYHIPAEPSFFENLDSMFVPERRRELYQKYDFNLMPVHDDCPFFSQFLRWESIPYLVRMFGERTVPFLELGYSIVLACFFQMAFAALLLILLPLLRLGLPGRSGLKTWTIPFFSGLGLGYMFFEIMLIHELVLYFGHQIFAAAAGISSLLFFSGLGSLMSGRLFPQRSGHGMAALLVGLVILLYFFILSPLLHKTIALALIPKLFVFLLLVALPATAMGMPFPLGLMRLAGYSKSQAAWAWGINGCVSVVSAGLAAIIAVESGFSALMLIACMAYGVAALSAFVSKDK